MRASWLVALALVAGCRTSESTGPADIEAGAPRRGRALEAWAVLDDAERVGSVVRFEVEGDPPASVFLVRNVYDQDLGLIDELGRAWRFRPHAAEHESLGAGTVSEGAARILGARGGAILEALPLPRRD